MNQFHEAIKRQMHENLNKTESRLVDCGLHSLLREVATDQKIVAHTQQKQGNGESLLWDSDPHDEYAPYLTWKVTPQGMEYKYDKFASIGWERGDDNEYTPFSLQGGRYVIGSRTLDSCFPTLTQTKFKKAVLEAITRKIT